jgi:hypothetical protein
MGEIGCRRDQGHDGGHDDPQDYLIDKKHPTSLSCLRRGRSGHDGSRFRIVKFCGDIVLSGNLIIAAGRSDSFLSSKRSEAALQIFLPPEPGIFSAPAPSAMILVCRILIAGNT